MWKQVSDDATKAINTIAASDVICHDRPNTSDTKLKN